MFSLENSEIYLLNTFTGDEKYFSIKAKSETSNIEAVELLLNALGNARIRGAWQMFMEALHSAGQSIYKVI